MTRKVKTGEFKGQRINVPGLLRFKDQAVQSDLLVHSVKRVLLGGGQNAIFEVPFHVAAAVDVYVDGDTKGRRLTGRFQSLELVDNKLISGLFDPKPSANGLELNAEKKAFKFSHAANRLSRFQAHDGSTTQVETLSTAVTIGDASVQLQFGVGTPVGFIYKGCSLNGIWATAPYLHNGSVPNLDELLKKPSERVQKFEVGSLNFDKDKIGFKSEAGTGTFTLDTRLPGNGNGGHDYGDKEFSEDERKALIEYVKSL